MVQDRSASNLRSNEDDHPMSACFSVSPRFALRRAAGTHFSNRRQMARSSASPIWHSLRARLAMKPHVRCQSAMLVTKFLYSVLDRVSEWSTSYTRHCCRSKAWSAHGCRGAGGSDSKKSMPERCATSLNQTCAFLGKISSKESMPFRSESSAWRRADVESRDPRLGKAPKQNVLSRGLPQTRRRAPFSTPGSGECCLCAQTPTRTPRPASRGSWSNTARGREHLPPSERTHGQQNEVTGQQEATNREVPEQMLPRSSFWLWIKLVSMAMLTLGKTSAEYTRRTPSCSATRFSGPSSSSPRRPRGTFSTELQSGVFRAVKAQHLVPHRILGAPQHFGARRAEDLAIWTHDARLKKGVTAAAIYGWKIASTDNPQAQNACFRHRSRQSQRTTPTVSSEAPASQQLCTIAARHRGSRGVFPRFAAQNNPNRQT
eukprot:scaffold7392_cov286-Pinguiococcus_pyrenoidosus.AAC.10